MLKQVQHDDITAFLTCSTVVLLLFPEFLLCANDKRRIALLKRFYNIFVLLSKFDTLVVYTDNKITKQKTKEYSKINGKKQKKGSSIMDLKEATEVMMKFYQSGKMEMFHQVSLPKYSKEMEEQTIKDIESKTNRKRRTNK